MRGRLSSQEHGNMPHHFLRVDSSISVSYEDEPDRGVLHQVGHGQLDSCGLREERRFQVSSFERVDEIYHNSISQERLVSISRILEWLSQCGSGPSVKKGANIDRMVTG